MPSTTTTASVGLALLGVVLTHGALAGDALLTPGFVPVPVVPILPVPVPYVDLRSGRCVAGFVRNEFGVCLRHDDPVVACGPADSGFGPCLVAIPGARPYGLGPSLRLNY